MLFKIRAEHFSTGDQHVFTYDNETNKISTEDGFVFGNGPEEGQQHNQPEVVPFSSETGLRKSKQVQLLKIQLGLSCNYSCDYCSQRFVPHSEETNKHDIPAFMEKILNLEFDEDRGLKIEFWGGEPFVYWKTLKPLVAALKEKFKHWVRKPAMSVITNGSILTHEINDWLIENDFFVAVSHDGPAQYIRGPDPFDDPKQKEIILDLYSKLGPINRMSFNAMMSANNMSRKKVHEWFIEMTGDPNVKLGEGGIIDAYDEGGKQNSLNTKAQHFEYRKTSFQDLFVTKGNVGFLTLLDKIDDFTRSVLTHRPANTQGQKCGMDDQHRMAVNLHGDVMTCQNVTSESVGPNGKSHYGGNITDIENVKIQTSNHWRNRPHCSSCPVLNLCKGSCMFLDGDLWDISCENAYSDNIWAFAASFHMVTGGYIPIFIENDHLPDHRKDIFGEILEHKEVTKKKVIPIKISNEKTVVNGVEVYTESKVVN